MDAAAILANPSNAGILDYRWRRRDGLELRTLGLAGLNYWSGGGHPDIAERLAVLAGEIGRDAIDSLGGSFVIAHRSTATILATIIGTAYTLRVAPPLHDELHQADVSSTKTWSDGRTTDLFAEVGPDWVWGSWHNDEPRWLAETVAHYDRMGPGD